MKRSYSCSDLSLSQILFSIWNVVSNMTHYCWLFVGFKLYLFLCYGWCLLKGTYRWRNSAVVWTLWSKNIFLCLFMRVESECVFQRRCASLGPLSIQAWEQRAGHSGPSGLFHPQRWRTVSAQTPREHREKSTTEPAQCVYEVSPRSKTRSDAASLPELPESLRKSRRWRGSGPRFGHVGTPGAVRGSSS